MYVLFVVMMGKLSCFRPPRSITATAKLIHMDGELEEFTFPVRVSDLLPENPEVFVCDADEMGLGEFLSAVDGGEEMVLGKLYFELPVSWLSRRLRADVMASLAVKASAALAASSGGGERFRCCCCFFRAARKVEPLVVFDDDGKDVEIRRFDGGSTAVSAVVEGGGGGRRVVAGGRRHIACKKGKFTPQMSMIIEE